MSGTPQSLKPRMPLPIEFVIDGPPVSRQGSSRSRERWTRDVKNTASQHWGPNPPLLEAVRVEITNFFYGAAPDLDNMAKPILDALKGVVYDDDSQVSDLVCRKRDRNYDVPIPSPTQILLDRLGQPGPFVHVFVDNALNREVAN